MRSLIWIDLEANQGWACSSCAWSFPVPTLLSDPEAKAAYDRLAAARFRQHECASGKVPIRQAPRPQAAAAALPETIDTGLSVRARALVKHGYKPKDAVDLVLQEMQLEFSTEPRMLEKARREADEFLDKIRRGLI